MNDKTRIPPPPPPTAPPGRRRWTRAQLMVLLCAVILSAGLGLWVGVGICQKSGSVPESAFDVRTEQQEPRETQTEQELQEQQLAQARQEALAQAGQLAQNGDPLGAADALRTAMAHIGDDAELQSAVKAYEDAYIDGILQQVDALIQEKSFDSADALVSEALTHFPGHEALLQAQAQLDQAGPVYLMDVFAPYASERFEAYTGSKSFKSATVPLANGFSLGHIGSATFNLGGAYDSLSFSVGHIDGTAAWPTVVSVYGDGELLWELKMNDEDLPAEVVLPITGVKQLKFTAVQPPDGPFSNQHSYYGFGEIICEKNTE